MPSWESIIAITIAGLVLSASPGPSMFYVLSRSVGLGVNAGIASSIGLALGGIGLALLSAFGLSKLVEYSPTAFVAIQVAGVCYLTYLGLDMIRRAGKEEFMLSEVDKTPLMTVLYQGFLVELLNPKTLMFFLIFVPQFVDFSRRDVHIQTIVLGILVPLTAIPSDIVASLAGGATQKLAKNNHYGTLLERIGGLILIGLAVYILVNTWILN